MTVQVKICGITTREAADAALRAGADFAGLVFHAKSPRNLNMDQARTLAELLRGRTRIVALFAAPDDSDIESCGACREAQSPAIAWQRKPRARRFNR